MPDDATAHDDPTGAMEGGGEYSAHSLAQHSAGGLGLPLLERAVDAVAAVTAAPPVPDAGPIVIADLGAAGGRNELAPMADAILGLRAHGIRNPVVVVHTDIPTNDFTTLFDTIEQAPSSYLQLDDVFAFAAGRSFYERIFPAASVLLGWSGIAVHWLSKVPAPIPDHVYCAFATGAARDEFARQSAADWDAFLVARAAELRPGGQLVIVGGAALDDGTSGAEALMDALNDALRAEVAAGRITEAEYQGMNVPTWNRTLAEFAALFAPGGTATTAGLALLEQSVAPVADQYLAAYRADGDAAAFTESVSGFLRAFTEPSLFETLDRPAADRTALADRVYASVRDELASDPPRFETVWKVALLRIAKTSPS
jgi:hypothetical protein